MRWGEAIRLGRLPPALGAYQSALEARPLLIARPWVERWLRVQKLLLRGLQALLVRPETAEFLGVAPLWDERPLRLGCLRPDFIVSADGTMRICEINGRFAVNGFLCTAYLRDMFGEDGSSIRRALALPPGSCIVKGREPGWDIHQLSAEWGAPIVDHWGSASEVVLELHQDELTGAPPMPYWNDLRTQLLGHDKRLLQWLGDASRMERWLGAEARELAAAIVPTCSVSSFVDDGSGEWVLKPNRSGKGDGIVFARDGGDWRAALAAAPPEWVVQRHVESLIWDGERLVGTLLSRDQRSLGLGIFRSAPGRVVNVSGGGRVIFPKYA
ncbi:MAG: hypothetical protein KF760_27210 [Candidatus Eremiobacteraeota bacterium]|nr:hypothetical protein [Candidatus Eremiobacteraeota bacterium]MCW5871966.1 hypothetical protein [Candidatus Eremiobacteraeota bacterium]